METPKASVRKIGLNYGLYLALAGILISVIAYVTDNHLERPWWVNVLSFAASIIIIVYGLKAFKKDNGGFLSLGEAIKTGLAISLIAGIISAVYTYLFVTVIEPDFVSQLMDVTRDNMLEQNPNMTESQVESAMDITSKFMSPFAMITFSIIASLFFGFIISLIAGLVLKQNRPEH